MVLSVVLSDLDHITHPMGSRLLQQMSECTILLKTF